MTVTNEALTYAEIDLPKCGLTYGQQPCEAVRVGDNLGTGYLEFFNGTLAGWTGLNNTMTPALGGMVVTATADDPIIRKTGLSFSGNTNRYVTLEVTRLAAGATWNGAIFYTTGGHGESGSFFKFFSATDIFPIGQRVTVTADMHALTAGGADWSGNTITGLRIDFDQTGVGSFKVHAVRVGPLADETTATGTEKCFNTLKSCQDPIHYDQEDHPISMGPIVQTYNAIAAGSYDPFSQAINIGAVPTGDQNRKVLVEFSGYSNGGAFTIASATLGGKTGTIRSQNAFGAHRTAIIEFDDMDASYGTSATFSIDFSIAVTHLGFTVRRLIDAIYVDQLSTTTGNDNTGGTFNDVVLDQVIFAATTSWLLSTTVWTTLTEDVDSIFGGSTALNMSRASLLLAEFQTSGNRSFTAQQADNSAFYGSPTIVGFEDLDDGGSGGESINCSGYALNDVIVVFLESSGAMSSVPAGWTRVSGGPVTDSSTGDLNVLWHRFDATGAVSVLFPYTSADHVSGYSIVLRGCTDTGDPVHQFAVGQQASGTAVSIPGLTTTQANCVILDLIAWAADNAGPMYTGWTNASVTGLTEFRDVGFTGGNGGGAAGAYSFKETPGVVSATTTTAAVSGPQFYMKLALTPFAPQYSGMTLAAVRYQWQPQFRGTEETIRFGMDTGFNPKEIDSINNLDSVSHTPTVLSLGENLGTRESISLRLTDVKHPDVGPGGDKYWDERGYDPYEQGTMLARMIARQPYLRGRPIRWYEGWVGQTLEEMTVRNYLVESVSASANDEVTIVAKDPLKLADSDRALAPRPVDGFLLNDITNVATSATLTPTGIGNAQYATSGKLAIAGNEMVDFTRAGDVLTIVRAVEGTPASAHEQEDRVQTVLVYDAQDPADILYDLLVNYADVDPAWINLADWQSETANYLRRVYTTVIGEPTPVRKLIAEIIQQCGLAMWWDSEAATIRMIVLREVPADATVIDAEVRLNDAPRVQDQPEKRISQMLVYFGIKDPLKSTTDPNNFRSIARVINAESETNYDASAIKSIFARWIAPFARTTAIRVGDINVGRFHDAPHKYTFELFRTGPVKPVVGGAYRLKARNLQVFNGSLDLVPIQITSVRVTRDRYIVEAEEMRFLSLDEQDLTDRVITISGTNFNLNLKSIHDDIYPPLREGDTITFIFDENSKTGSNSELIPAVDVGTWPVGFTPHIELRGKWQGRGGEGGKGANDGGNAGSGGKNGHKGGTAFYTRNLCTLTYTTGFIWSGGGGGAGGSCADFNDSRGGGGGGGAGIIGGAGGIGPGNGEDGQPGTELAGGNYGRSYTTSTFWTGPSLKSNVHGGAGGAPGVAGGNQVGSYDVPGGSPGAAGTAIDGISYVTVIGAVGSRLGPQVN